MSRLERGFKSWAEKFADGLRRELGVEIDEPLCLERIASFFGAKLLTPQEIHGMTELHLRQLLNVDPSGWSAVTVCIGQRSVIIHNPKHSKGRQASNIAHEIAHLILEHEPTRLVMSPDGALVMRSFDEKQEEEANWLAWCLLLPRAAIIAALKKRATVEQIALQFGVSEPLVNFRVQKTGARVQIKRSPIT
ncbi:MAG: ImmA/IrrE family metallo-endopeptidase [Acidobacteriaceae bacterium]